MSSTITVTAIGGVDVANPEIVTINVGGDATVNVDGDSLGGGGGIVEMVFGKVDFWANPAAVLADTSIAAFVPEGQSVKALVVYTDGGAAIWERNAVTFGDGAPYWTFVEDVADFAHLGHVYTIGSTSGGGATAYVIQTADGSTFTVDPIAPLDSGLTADDAVAAVDAAIIDTGSDIHAQVVAIANDRANAYATVAHDAIVSEVHDGSGSALNTQLHGLIDPLIAAALTDVSVVRLDGVLDPLIATDGLTLAPMCIDIFADGQIVFVFNAATASLNGFWKLHEADGSTRPDPGDLVGPGLTYAAVQDGKERFAGGNIARGNHLGVLWAIRKGGGDEGDWQVRHVAGRCGRFWNYDGGSTDLGILLSPYVQAVDVGPKVGGGDYTITIEGDPTGPIAFGATSGGVGTDTVTLEGPFGSGTITTWTGVFTAQILYTMFQNHLVISA